MSFLSIFIVSFVIALSGALMPGPLLATVIYESTNKGFRTGPLMILGHAILEVLMVVIIIFGLAHFINNPFILKLIYFFGGCILLYFGITMLFKMPKLSLNYKHKLKKDYSLIFTGIIMSIANPYWLIWWLTIGIGLVMAAKKIGLIAILVFFVGHISADFIWYSIVSFGMARGKNIISEKIYKRIILVCAVILIGFGIYFTASGAYSQHI